MSDRDEDLLDLEDEVGLAAARSPGWSPVDRGRLLADPLIAGTTRSLERVAAPIALVEGSSTLDYLFQNAAYRALLDRYGFRETPSFAASIWNQMGGTALSPIMKALKDHNEGYEWKGEISLRHRDRHTLVLKAHIMPVWPAPEESLEGPPPVFIVLFDDVTVERHDYQKRYLTALLDASLLKDNATGRHVQRVNRYARSLAEALYRDGRWPEIDRDFIEDIGWLAAMHDVGKIGISERVIYKAGPLDEAEWREMREHPITGALILSSFPNRMAQDIARSHHERWNGSGYPFNLVGDAIPVSARIVAIADVYDALRMKRSYKQPYEHGAAVDKLVEARGSHFDPGIVEVFLAIAEDFRAIYEANRD